MPTAKNWKGVPPTRNKCIVCNEVKDNSQFRTAYNNWKGVEAKCKICVRAYNREKYSDKSGAKYTTSQKYLEDNRAKVNAGHRARRVANPAIHLLQCAKRRAKKKGVPFEITREDVVVPEFCPVLGIKLVVNGSGGGPDSPSIDRIIPKLGYVPGNIAVVCHRANSMKQDATLEEMEKLLEFYRGVM